MKKMIPLLASLFFIQQGISQTDTATFHSQRISDSAAIVINLPADRAFALFGAFEERKWSLGWNPRLLYPATETMEEGTTFMTPGHSRSEPELLWIVDRYDIHSRQVEYLVLSTNRYIRISIWCHPFDHEKAEATIRYSFTSLSAEGQLKNERSLRGMFAHQLKDWEESMAYYLDHGTAMPHLHGE